MSLYSKSYQMHGIKGIYLVLCSYVFNKILFPVRIANFGILKTYHEILNYVDNFCSGELRCPEIESHIKSQDSPIIVDIGINIGITTRWWFCLNANAHVIGIDMIQEALDYTTKSVRGMESDRKALFNWTPISKGVGAQKETVHIGLDNPLEGTNSLETSSGKESRAIQVDTLDNLLSSFDLPRIHFLKIDIEGYAPEALKGAIETLKKVDYIAVESHNRKEVVEVSSMLINSGFASFWVNGRTMWFTTKKI